MAGIIQKAAKPGAVMSSATLSPQAVEGKMQIPPQLQDAYRRVVIAGMKIMFDPQTHQQMLTQLQQPGPMANNLGEGVFGLMLLLYQQSNHTIPPAVMIPAALTLLAHAVDFVEKSKMGQVSMQDWGNAANILIVKLLEKGGIDPQKFVAGAQAMRKGPTPGQPPQPPTPAAPPQPSAPGGQ